MNELQAIKILGNIIQPDNSLHGRGNYIHWLNGEEKLTIDGRFTSKQLKVISWWMIHKSGKQDKKKKSYSRFDLLQLLSECYDVLTDTPHDKRKAGYDLVKEIANKKALVIDKIKAIIGEYVNAR